MRLLEWLQDRIERIPEEKRNDIHKTILQKIWTPCKVFNYDDQPPKDFYSFKFKALPHLDRYICGDVFELEEKFDLVTSFSSMEWFNANTSFKKISDLLNVGGVYYFWVSNWWCDVNVTRLCGHFPYAMQRMSREDYFRYLEEHLPENAEAMKHAYDFFDPNHPTLADYIEIAYENGLVPLAFRSPVEEEQFTHRRGIHPLGYALNEDQLLREVLDDIHQIRPDVRLHDLLPFTHNVIFVKMDKDKRLSEEALRQAYAKLDFHFRPQSRILKGFKALAGRVLPPSIRR